MNVCIFDDEKVFQNSLNDIVEDYLDINYPEMNYTVHCFASATEMLDYVNTNIVDVVFLDISTKDDENAGLSAARSIRAANEKAHIIFVTSRKDKIARSFDGLVRPTGFLIKPVDSAGVHELMGGIVRQILKSEDYVSFKFGCIEYLLHMEEICYLQKSAHKMVVSTENRTIEVTNTINSLLGILPDNFVQIDKGIIINLNFADKIDYAERSIIL